MSQSERVEPSQQTPPTGADPIAAQSLGFIAQIECQIESFRKLCAETAQRAADLEIRDAQIRERHAEAEKREETARAALAAAAERGAEAERKHGEHEARTAELNARAELLHAQEREVVQAAAELERNASERAAALEAKASEIDRSRTAAAELEGQLAQREAEVAERARTADEQHQAAQQRMADANEAETRLLAEIEARETALRERESALPERERELADREKQAEQAATAESQHAAQQLAEARQELELAQQQAQQAATAESLQAAQQLAEARQQLELAQHQAQQAGQELERTRAEGQTALQQFTDLARRHAELAEQSERVARERDESSVAAAAARREHSELLGRLAQLGQELEAARRERDESASAHAGELAVIRAGLVETQAQVRSQSESEALARAAAADQARVLAELESKLAAALAESAQAAEQAQSALAASEAALTQARADSASAQSRVEELRRELDAARNEAPAVGPGVEELIRLTAAISKRDEALRTLAGRVADMGAQVDEARDEAERSGQRAEAVERELVEARVQAKHIEHAAASRIEGACDGDAVVLKLRRSRLAQYKALLAVHSRKIVQAKNALMRRQAECDEVLAQRARLNEAVLAVREQKEALESRKTQGVAAVIGLCLVASFSILLVLGWTGAAQIAPAAYAARATLSADFRGREPTEDEQGAWLASHQALVKDPQVIVSAAEQFSRRGMDALATAEAVTVKLERDISVIPDPAGQLTMEWRGAGRERSARELETYLTALVSRANQIRDLRGDGAATAITKPPEAGQDSISSQRTWLALGFAAGGTVAFGALALLIYAVTARAKQQFERSQAELANAM